MKVIFYDRKWLLSYGSVISSTLLYQKPHAEFCNILYRSWQNFLDCGGIMSRAPFVFSKYWTLWVKKAVLSALYQMVVAQSDFHRLIGNAKLCRQPWYSVFARSPIKRFFDLADGKKQSTCKHICLKFYPPIGLWAFSEAFQHRCRVTGAGI